MLIGLVLSTFFTYTNPIPGLGMMMILPQSKIDLSGNTIESRFKVPAGFKRVEISAKTYPNYLRNLPLKPNGTPVKLYNGKLKANQNAHIAVIDLEIGTKNLQQCADAVIRLRAEYLFSQGKPDSIHFNLTNGFRVDFTEWTKGKRVKVEGHKTYWKQEKAPSTTYETFREYLDFIFTYAGTLSLSKELKNVNINDIQIGDVFIQGGSPGHAVIVVDMAYNPVTGEKVFLLAQSYMPAQDIHILINPNDPQISPWYNVNFGILLKTPEWEFTPNDLKRF